MCKTFIVLPKYVLLETANVPLNGVWLFDSDSYAHAFLIHTCNLLTMRLNRRCSVYGQNIDARVSRNMILKDQLRLTSSDSIQIF